MDCSQVINKPKHFINGGSSSIDLTFSSNLTFITYYGVELSIFKKCHHNITYDTSEFNASPLPPYYRDIWDYNDAETKSIQKAISSFDSSWSQNIWLEDHLVDEHIYYLCLEERSILFKRYYHF